MPTNDTTSNAADTTSGVSPTTTPAAAPTRPAGLHPFAPKPLLAWQVSADDRAAVRDEDLVPMNLDLHAAAITALGSYDEIRALRDQAATLPGFDVSLIDKLPIYASAAMQSQSLFVGASVDSQELARLYERANELRELLHTEVVPLVHRGHVAKSEVAEYKGAFGYRIAIADLLLLTNALRRYQARFPDDARVATAEIEEAEAITNELIHGVGRKEQAPAVPGTAALDRQRACTLFVNTYDAVRRAVAYLRWREGDADEITPSLYLHPNRMTKRRDPATNDVAPPSAPAPVGAPVATPSSGLNPFSS